MPAMRWSIDDEAKDLEDAIWAAAEVAEKIDGAYVQVCCVGPAPAALPARALCLLTFHGSSNSATKLAHWVDAPRALYSELVLTGKSRAVKHSG